MSSKTHNSHAGKERHGSSGDSVARQERESRDPAESNARDREGRQGGDHAQNR
jgi:hypothetical protein